MFPDTKPAKYAGLGQLLVYLLQDEKNLYKVL